MQEEGVHPASAEVSVLPDAHDECGEVPLPKKRYSRWMFTGYKYASTEVLLDEMHALAKGAVDEGKLAFIVYQQEKCPKTQRLHIQGFLLYPGGKSARMASVKTLLKEESVHLEAAKSANAACYKYCTKKDSRVTGPWEYGIMPEKAGSHPALDHYAALIAAGTMTALQVTQESPATWVKYFKGLQSLELTVGLPPSIISSKNEARRLTSPPEVIVIFGPPGCGKTTLAHKLLVDRGIPYAVHNANQGAFGSKHFWDDYHGEEALLIDEYRGQIPFAELLQVLDVMPMVVSTHGMMSQQMKAKVFVFCSMESPSKWYPHQVNIGALKRRITQPINILKWNAEHGVDSGKLLKEVADAEKRLDAEEQWNVEHGVAEVGAYALARREEMAVNTLQSCRMAVARAQSDERLHYGESFLRGVHDSQESHDAGML